jgi:lipopolysaccharide exporter
MSTDDQPKHRSNAIVWTTFTYFSGRLITLVTATIIARVLDARQYGLVALALTILGYLDLINDFGVPAALIWVGDDERSSDTAFALDMTTGIIASAITFGIAVPAAHWLHEPGLVSILRVLSMVPIIGSIGAIHEARLRRRMHFRRAVPVEVGRTAVKAVVAIGLALSGAGVWSLVWAQVAATAYGSIGYLFIYRWRPGLQIDRATAGRMVRYGGSLAVVGAVGVFIKNVDYLIVGARLGAAALGYYSLAFRLPELAVIGTANAASQVAFPLYVRANRRPGALADTIVRSMRSLAVIVVPIGLGLAVLSPETIGVVFGSKWSPSVSVMTWLAIYATASALCWIIGDAYKAVGRPGVMVWMGVGRAPVAVVVLWFTAPHGIKVVAIAQAAMALADLVVQYLLARVLLKVSVRRLVGTAVLPVAGGALMALVVALVRPHLAVALWARMMILALIGAAVYLAIVRVVGGWTVKRVVHGFQPEHDDDESGGTSAELAGV